MWREGLAPIRSRAHGEAELRLADEDNVAILERLTNNAPIVHVHAIGAVQVFDDRMGGTGKNHRVVATDELRINLHVVIRRAPDRGLPAEQVHDFRLPAHADE